jgi:hypothetical protein
MGTTRSPRAAIEKLKKSLPSLREGRPLRDAFMFVPAAAGALAALVVAVKLTADAVDSFPARQGGASLLLWVMSFEAGFAGVMLALSIPWAAWAGLVSLVSWIGRRERKQVLEIAPFAVPLPPVPRPDRVEAALEWLAKRKWRVVGVAFIVLQLLFLAFELRAPSVARGDAVETATRLLGFTLLLTLTSYLFLGAVGAALGIERRLRPVFRWLRERLERQRWRDPAIGVAPLRTSRAHVRGVAREGERSLRAPLSGARCIGFRLVGHVGHARIDDAALADLAIELPGEVAVARSRSAVMLARVTGAPVRVLTDAQRERVALFLKDRDLPMTDDLELAEALLVDGQEVVVHGAADSERHTGVGYRTAAERRVLRDEDGRPLVVEAVTAGPRIPG